MAGPRAFPREPNELRYETDAQRAVAAALPAAERQRRVHDMLIRYPLFRDTVAAIEHFHRPVKGGMPDRGKVCGILGPPRAGKSWAISSYLRALGDVDTPNAIMPKGVYVDAVDGGSSLDLALSFKRVLGLGNMGKVNAQKMLAIATDEIQEHGAELVVIDDSQFLFAAPSRKTIEDFEGFLIQLAERKCCNIVLVGTEGIHAGVDRVRPLQGRGAFPRRFIEGYDWRTTEGRTAFRYLLDDIDERLPFREPSNLADETIAAHFYAVSDGLIGQVMNFVEPAAHLAINEGAPCVTLEHLHMAGQERRRLYDPFEPFASRVDMSDPAARLRKAEAPADAREPTLHKKRGKSRS